LVAVGTLTVAAVSVSEWHATVSTGKMPFSTSGFISWWHHCQRLTCCKVSWQCHCQRLTCCKVSWQWHCQWGTCYYVSWQCHEWRAALSTDCDISEWHTAMSAASGMLLCQLEVTLSVSDMLPYRLAVTVSVACWKAGESTVVTKEENRNTFNEKTISRLRHTGTEV
jgi:hypothetical protein